jgi:hypothetical protein
MQPTRPAVLFSSPWRRVAGVVAAACASLPALARGEEAAAVGSPSAPVSKAECAEAFEQSQRLRNSFRYVAATAKALRCANPECGAVLSEECGKLYSELEAATPSIVLGARNEDGEELRSVAVSIDGEARRLPLDGTPLLLDPGNHEFTFIADGFEPLRQTVMILAGERFRPVIGELESKHVPPDTEAPKARQETGPRGERAGPPLASYVLGGIGVVGFAGFVGFRMAGANEYDSLARDCQPTCAQESVDAARQKYVFSYVGLAIGGAASIAAVTLYLASPSKRSPASATLQLRQLPSGMAAHLTGHF